MGCQSYSREKMTMSSTSQDTPLAIGIDMGGTSIKMGVVRGTDIIAKAEPVDTQQYVSPEKCFEQVGARIRALKERYPALAAVGMGLPGFVDHRAGVADSLTNIPGWYDVPVAQLLTEMSGLPSAADNDANCMAYAEWKLGAGQGMDDVVCLTLGTGVGSGIIAGGRMLRGHCCAAGEIGQVSIDYQGREGYYHNLGALEDYIGNRELAADAVQAYAAAGTVRTAAECTPLAMELAAKAGDPLALAYWEELARKLACGLVNCHYILNPEAFIIGGGIAKAGELLFAPLRRFVQAQVYPKHYAKMKILPALFGNDAGMIGAARMALDEHLS